MAKIILGVLLLVIGFILTEQVSKWGIWSRNSILLCLSLLIAGVLIGIPIDWAIARLRRNKQLASERNTYQSLTPTPSPNLLGTLNDDEKKILGWSYSTASSHLVLIPTGSHDCAQVNSQELFPWTDKMGLEPRVHRDRRTHWLSVSERMIDAGYFTQIGDGVYRLSGKGMDAAKLVEYHPFPSQRFIDELLSRYRELSECLSIKQQRLLRQILREGHGQVLIADWNDAIYGPDRDYRPYVKVGSMILGNDNKDARTGIYEQAKVLAEHAMLEPHPMPPIPLSGSIDSIAFSRTGRFRLSGRGRELAEML